MLKDRGTKKWTSLMLPEHVTYLKDMWTRELKEKKPMLDEQQRELMDGVLREAIQRKQKVQLVCYRNGHMESLIGFVARYGDNQLHLQVNVSKKMTVYLNDIVSLELL